MFLSMGLMVHVMQMASDDKNVWRNMLQDLDEEGRPYVKIMINEGKTGPAKVIFKKNGALWLRMLSQ